MNNGHICNRVLYPCIPEHVTAAVWEIPHKTTTATTIFTSITRLFLVIRVVAYTVPASGLLNSRSVLIGRSSAFFYSKFHVPCSFCGWTTDISGGDRRAATDRGWDPCNRTLAATSCKQPGVSAGKPKKRRNGHTMGKREISRDRQTERQTGRQIYKTDRQTNKTKNTVKRERLAYGEQRRGNQK